MHISALNKPRDSWT